MSRRFGRMIAEAIKVLHTTHPRAKYYAERVLRGGQGWSGADLAGKARKYGGHYAEQRQNARFCLRQAGGLVIPTDHGYLRTVLPVGMDDFGSGLYLDAGGRVWTSPSTGKVNAIQVYGKQGD